MNSSTTHASQWRLPQVLKRSHQKRFDSAKLLNMLSTIKQEEKLLVVSIMCETIQWNFPPRHSSGTDELQQHFDWLEASLQRYLEKAIHKRRAELHYIRHFVTHPFVIPSWHLRTTHKLRQTLLCRLPALFPLKTIATIIGLLIENNSERTADIIHRQIRVHPESSAYSALPTAAILARPANSEVSTPARCQVSASGNVHSYRAMLSKLHLAISCPQRVVIRHNNGTRRTCRRVRAIPIHRRHGWLGADGAGQSVLSPSAPDQSLRNVDGYSAHRFCRFL